MTSSRLRRCLISLTTLAVASSLIFLGGGAGQAVASPRQIHSSLHQVSMHIASEPACGTGNRVTSLVVSRIVLGPRKERFTFPDRLAITRQSKAHTILDALCGLPSVPKDVTFNCPLDYGVEYSLIFRYNSMAVLRTTLDASGCRFVTGLQTKRFTSMTFWHHLADALELPRGTQFW